MKMIAPRSGWPTREIALLIADPSPEKRPGIEPISGARQRRDDQRDPDPEQEIAGRTSTSTSSGGIRVAGVSTEASHGSESDGSRANQSSPPAMISGPTTRNGRAPIRAATRPDAGGQDRQQDPARQADEPGPEGRVAEHALEDQRLVAERHVEGAVDEERRRG